MRPRYILRLTIAITTDRNPDEYAEALAAFLETTLIEDNKDAEVDPDPSVIGECVEKVKRKL